MKINLFYFVINLSQLYPNGICYFLYSLPCKSKIPINLITQRVVLTNITSANGQNMMLKSVKTNKSLINGYKGEYG